MFPPLKKPFKAPPIFVLRSVLDEIHEEIRRFPKIETAWGGCGFRYPNGSIIATNVLLPEEDEIVRSYAHVKIGGDEMGKTVAWLLVNDVVYQKIDAKMRGSAVYDFTGYAHSHHGINVREHSSTDVKSVVESVTKEGLTVALSPLVYINKPEELIVKPSNRAGTLNCKAVGDFDIRFYYYSRMMADAGYTEALLVRPKVLETVKTMRIPPLGWRFANGNDFREQVRHLTHFGATVDIRYQEFHGGPPYEIVFAVRKANWKAVLQIIVPWDYPTNAPRFVLGEIPNATASEQGDYVNAPDLLNGDLWHPGEDFIEAVFRLEARGEL